ncbi:MAG: PilT/PilU family type 4a pilus ATPase [Halothiobacillaceae bacterium]|nr:MAG: PilT/PilU family type 4a pilus ATPase [Halothiobacillaceae bacterium]
MSITLQLDPYLRLLAERGGSDLFFTVGAPPQAKIEGDMRPVGQNPIPAGGVAKLIYPVLTPEQIHQFEQDLELNLATSLEGYGRFRINVFMQRGEVSSVIRHIKDKIPSFDDLRLPAHLKEIILEKNGLILIVGATGSGKSSSLAAMLGHRIQNVSGHVLTIEDPVEFTFKHGRSIINQREVGVDTHSYTNALKEAMREAPDVILIGETRDKETMNHAIAFADTGHLCLTTLHATNSHQALDRILRFFPPDARDQLLMDLSLTLKAIIAQRLVMGVDGKRLPAVEVLINSPYISDLIRRGRVDDLPEVMSKGGLSGMQTFDQALFELYQQGQISKDEALKQCDSRRDLEWRMNFSGEEILPGAHNMEAPTEAPGELTPLPPI